MECEAGRRMGAAGAALLSVSVTYGYEWWVRPETKVMDPGWDFFSAGLLETLLG